MLNETQQKFKRSKTLACSSCTNKNTSSALHTNTCTSRAHEQASHPSATRVFHENRERKKQVYSDAGFTHCCLCCFFKTRPDPRLSRMSFISPLFFIFDLFFAAAAAAVVALKRAQTVSALNNENVKNNNCKHFSHSVFRSAPLYVRLKVCVLYTIRIRGHCSSSALTNNTRSHTRLN